MRINNWIKNIFIFAPIILSGKLFIAGKLTSVFHAFMAFCLISSSVYIFNDLFDKKYDRLHPFKKNRPLASGIISSSTAYLWGTALLIISSSIALKETSSLFFLLFLYFSINLLYSLFLRNKFPFNILIISTGFILRIWSGAIIIGITPSIWLQITTFFTTLYFATAKRTLELYTLKNISLNESTIKYYLKNIPLKHANRILLLFALSGASSYIFLAISIKKTFPLFIYSFIFVIYGFYRSFLLLNKETKKNDYISMIGGDILSLVNFFSFIGWIIFSLYFY